VVSGRIREYLATGADREVRAGDSRGFGPRHVHDVCNPYAEPAVSVHAYSPPLTEMSYYTLLPGGRLQRVCTEQTALPEAQSAIMPSLTMGV
jgi:hypothetical protein